MAPTTPINTISPDHLRIHLRLVDQVAAITPPPAEWVTLRERFDGFVKLGDTAPMRTRLNAAVVNGSDDVDLELLRAAAIAEQFGLESAARVTNGVKKVVLAAMVAAYGKVAAANYAKIAAEFDAAAGKFTTAAAQCGNPESVDADIVGADAKTRTAWLDSQKFAAELTRLAPIVVAAAELGGIRIRPGDDTARLALTVDPGELHRRRVWECWGAEGRCGRWSALAALGASIRAWPADKLGDFEPYREPRPLQERERPTGRVGIGELYTWDPEDGPEPEPVTPRRQRVQFLP